MFTVELHPSRQGEDAESKKHEHQFFDPLAIWPQLASPEQYRRFLRRYVWGAWDILWPKRASDRVWPQYLEALKLLGGQLHELTRCSSMRRYILQMAGHRCFDQLDAIDMRVIRPYDEPWTPASALLDSINHVVVSTTDRVRISKTAFYRSFLMPPNHWLLAQEDKQCLLPQIADPLQLIGIVRMNGKWQYGVRLSALKQGPVRLFLEQVEKTLFQHVRKRRLRAAYTNLARALHRNPRTPTRSMVSLVEAMGIQVSESTLRRYRTRILLQQAREIGAADQNSDSSASGILHEIGQNSAQL